MTVLSFGQTIPVTGPNIGFPGNISRQGERVVTARQFVPFTSSNNLNFGDPAVIIPNTEGGYYDSVADYVADAEANIALLAQFGIGMAIREVKTQLTYPYNSAPGVQQTGYYSNGQMAEVLERGNATVLLTAGTPTGPGNQVYTRHVLNSSNVPAGFIGDWEVTPAATDLFTKPVGTGGAAAGQAVIPIASTTNIQVGQLVTGQPGLPLGAYVASLVANTSVTLNANLLTAMAAGAVLNFSNLVPVPGCVTRTGYLDANNMLEIVFQRRYLA